MPKVIVGLGNPGEQYINTRHNIGRTIIREFIKNIKHFRKITLKHSRGIYYNKDKNFYVFISKTFMNLSGIAIKEIRDYLLLKGEKNIEFLIVYDDIDIPIGFIRFRKMGGSGGHNGIKSIISELNTENFYRLRIGIGCENAKRNPDFVLGYFKDEEIKLLKEILPTILNALELFIEKGIDFCMNNFNKKVQKKLL